MPSLADAVRSMGLVVGDVVEIGMAPGWLSGIISEAINESSAWREGLLIEVTAIGEQHILGFALMGDKRLGDGEAYRDFTWARLGSHVFRDSVGDLPSTAEPASPRERMFTDGATARKVGSKVNGEYVWTLPDLINIYTRCQG